MKNRFKIATSVVLLLGVAGVFGCSEAVDEVTNTANCHSVCQKYSDCYDDDYDVDGCTDKCEDEADASSNREERLEACDSCIDDKSCASATFTCADECAGVI